MAQTEYMATQARSDIIHILNVPFPNDTNFYYKQASEQQKNLCFCVLSRTENARIFSSREKLFVKIERDANSSVGVYLSDYCQLGVIRKVLFSGAKAILINWSDVRNQAYLKLY